ncbi:allophanate hydrolase [Cellulomonas shaoxiangyii]|uniref:Allophanate hydrolase n=1 Tax=Cellulomonas shaoxiangyii TaxID=2566013 RepID=A0A4V1CN73_9CELL|nr:allophanate hydrolase [Cellulomonas shaoxiangyii]TGY85039.1 allophanate hydrolase [Cellulomonas shaoxiangyii]
MTSGTRTPDEAAVPGGADGYGPAAADGTARARVRAAYARVRAADRPEVWIALVPEADALAAADAVDARVAAGERLPLAGTTLAVKDNVDVAGLPTTAGCPSYATDPAGRPGPAARTAPAVQALVDAGAVVLGKTNLDQFATGLVGTRSPYGAVRHATLPDRVSGGSSSGSAVAVALGVADIGIGTDTAGSGRVPAAFHGLVGIKTTIGLVPTAGVVPACPSYDVVTTFTRDLATGVLATRLMVGAGAGAGSGSGVGSGAGDVDAGGAVADDDAAPDAGGGARRRWPADVRVGLRDAPVVAVPRPADLAPLSDAWRAAFAGAVARARAVGARAVEVDVSGLLAAGRLLYDGALVAERYAAVGDFLATGPADADPTVASIVLAGGSVPAAAYVRDRLRLDEARAAAVRTLDGCDLLLLPTTTEHPTIAAVQADPVGINRRLGTYTNFVNLLNLAAVAVPVGEADGGPFGVTVLARACEDQLALDLAARLLGEGTAGGPRAAAGSAGGAGPAGRPASGQVPAPAPSSAPSSAPLSAPLLVPGTVELLVVGAHLRGQPLQGQLADLGARFDRAVTTSDAYRLVALDTVPRKPGLVRVGPGDGAPIAGEVWRLAPGALGVFLAALPAPMTLGQVELADGTWVVGFGCTAEAGATGADLTDTGGWLAALARGR